MRLSKTIKVTQFETDFVISSGLERKVKITRQPINNDLEYPYSLKLRIENYQMNKRATLNTPREDVVSLEERKDMVVLNCYKPPETIRPVYGTWCLACCAICPLPSGLTYTHLKSGIT